MSSSGFDIETLFREGLKFHKQGNSVRAAKCYQQVLTQNPNHAGAWHLWGVMAMTNRDYLTALQRIERAISLCDTKAVYFNNYGVAFKFLQRYQEAKEAFEKALTLHPEYADAWSNYGQILLILKDEEQNIEHALIKALQFVPNHPDALLHLAELRHRQERHAECAELLIKILPRQPNDVGLLYRIAESHISAKQYEQAIDFLLRAAQISPNQEDIQHRLGICYGETGYILKAKTHFRNAASLPKGKSPWHWKHLWYCPIYFDNAQQIDDYWQQLHLDLDKAIAKNNIYDWRTLVYEGFTSSFHLPHHDKCCREVKEKFTQLFAPSFAQFQRPELKYPHRQSGKIRVGFLVTPGHEGGFLRNTIGVIQQLDPQRFEVILLYNQTTVQRYEKIANQANVTHVPFDWNFEHSVKVIRDTECDIIYYWKVGADVWNFFLPMTYPAPIQYTASGTHGTSGLEQIDYSLSCSFSEIPTAQEHYTENLFLMDQRPKYCSRISKPQHVRRSDLGLSETGAIYFCPHRVSKYHPDYDFYLKGILEGDPAGHIVLLMGDSPLLAEKFKARMKRQIGETLFRRMIFLPTQPVNRYNQLMASATMILDSHIYAGAITADDAFSYGIPSVTQEGSLLVQRSSMTSYQMMNIEGPVTTNRDDYIREAMRLGTDRDYYQYLSGLIQERSHVLFEQSEVISQIENFYETIIANHT